MKKYRLKDILVLAISVTAISCSNNDNSRECSTFLECLDGTYWTNDSNQSIWTFNDNVSGEYLELYITGDNCHKYENNFIVDAVFNYQTKMNLSEDFNGVTWIYSVVNDNVIEKTKSTGGSTSFLYKTDKSFLDDILKLDECSY
ncbi:hypothetical protein OAR02_02960 [Flavobacteriaceae bacterium]|nr:hypothetical protein [Flavobacteriaceae bacterium]